MIIAGGDRCQGYQGREATNQNWGHHLWITKCGWVVWEIWSVIYARTTLTSHCHLHLYNMESNHDMTVFCVSSHTELTYLLCLFPHRYWDWHMRTVSQCVCVCVCVYVCVFVFYCLATKINNQVSSDNKVGGVWGGGWNSGSRWQERGYSTMHQVSPVSGNVHAFTSVTYTVSTL